MNPGVALTQEENIESIDVQAAADEPPDTGVVVPLLEVVVVVGRELVGVADAPVADAVQTLPLLTQKADTTLSTTWRKSSS